MNVSGSKRFRRATQLALACDIDLDALISRRFGELREGRQFSRISRGNGPSESLLFVGRLVWTMPTSSYAAVLRYYAVPRNWSNEKTRLADLVSLFREDEAESVIAIALQEDVFYLGDGYEEGIDVSDGESATERGPIEVRRFINVMITGSCWFQNCTELALRRLFDGDAPWQLLLRENIRCIHEAADDSTPSFSGVVVGRGNSQRIVVERSDVQDPVAADPIADYAGTLAYFAYLNFLYSSALSKLWFKLDCRVRPVIRAISTIGLCHDFQWRVMTAIGGSHGKIHFLRTIGAYPINTMNPLGRMEWRQFVCEVNRCDTTSHLFG